VRLTRDQLRQRGQELRDLVNGWDPIGVTDDPERPSDEYECLIGPLLRRLEVGAGADEVSAFLAHELEYHFGLDPEPLQTTAFAERLAQWYAGRWPDSEAQPASE